MSWKVEVVVDDSGEWVGDPLRFKTKQEALAYARDLEFRCSAVRDKRTVKSQDPSVGGVSTFDAQSWWSWRPYVRFSARLEAAAEKAQSDLNSSWRFPGPLVLQRREPDPLARNFCYLQWGKLG
jgi:hypothetical protein